jgi:hypothetical protein
MPHEVFMQIYLIVTHEILIELHLMTYFFVQCHLIVPYNIRMQERLNIPHKILL